jgi:hypothetical protein
MWRSRLRATFLSNRDAVEAGDEPSITHKTGYDIYRLLPAGFFYSFNRTSLFSILAPSRFCFSGRQKAVEDRQALLQFWV